MKRAVILVLLGLTGCGTMPGSTSPEPEADQPLVEDTSSVESSDDPLQEVVPIVVSETPVLAWGHFGGLPPEVVLWDDGEYRVFDFVRHSEGVYEVVYDVSTFEAGLIVPLVSGHGSELEGGTNAIIILGATQLLERTTLTIRVVSVSTFIDPDNPYVLRQVDALFDLVLFGEP